MPVNSFENYPMSWKPTIKNRNNSLYKELATQLENDIKSGILKPGTMLPPQRELADYMDINLSTVSRAFKLCEQKGLVYGAVGRGTFVASDVAHSTVLLSGNEEKLIEMGAIMPSATPNQIILETIQRLIREPEMYRLLQYDLVEDNLLQKRAAAKWLERSNYHVDSDNILFAAGGQNALAGILSSMFRCGDKIGTNEVIYPGIKSLANMLGIQLVPIPNRENEAFADTLRQVCRKEDLKGVYLIADYHNPTTYSMDTRTREEIAQAAKELGIIVIEDGINSLLRENPLPPIASYAPDQVIYLSSLSKTLSPGLRIAFVAAPPSYYKNLSLGFYNMNIMVSPLMIEAAIRLIHSKAADDILESRREHTRNRNRRLNSILDGYEIYGDELCNFRWLVLPEGFTGRTFELYAKNAGVQLYCAERFVVGSSKVPSAVRIAVTAEENDEKFEKGLKILKKILESKTEFTYF
ncbi:aminotransferase-like domain-containing protein [Konateibacter massiliensis]|uniref:aminotransferase-like domain-containing protein n=1 Tax=Konateibacter massiliensis TaxID=2002841 RepID=UPI000C14D6E2|nr:PLP-dependent aminotransferase family protein [Konateibacter massiliensis]